MKKINISIDKIRSMLQEIKYPGFNRDIVSFGMVKNISIEGITIDISLQINSDNKENLIQLRDRIEKTLHKNGLDEVNIHFHKPAKQSESSGDAEKKINQLPIPGVENIIAIASGKGGVGKSTVAVNIAATLRKEYRVGLLDLDIYGPSLPMLVGMDTQPQMTEDKKLIPLEKYTFKVKPDILYVNHRGDVHQDHKAVFSTAVIVSRAISSHKIGRVLSYEIPSATEQAPPFPESAFLPNFYVDISKYIDKKMLAMNGLHCIWFLSSR